MLPSQKVIPFFKTLKQHFEGVQKALFKKVKEMEEIFDQMSAEVDQNIVDKQCAEIERKNLLIANENLIANCLSNQLLFDLETLLQEKDNVIRNLKAQVSKMNDRSYETYNAKDVTALIEQNERVRAEIEKVKQHYKELYDSIKITRAHTSEKTSTMLNEIESLKAQLKNKVFCHDDSVLNKKILTLTWYAIDVKPIPPPFKNNRSAHLNYINHLKESVETFREIVEEARVVKPLDNALNYACQYIKLSQELLEYVIGTCPKEFNTKDNKAASTPLTRKKQVWKVKGKLSANGLNKAKQVWKATGKVFANVGHQWRPTGKMFLLGEQCPLTRVPMKCRTDRPLVYGLRLFKTYDGESFKAQEVYGKIQASFFIIMASVDVSSGPAPQRKEKCTLQCALSLKEEKSSCFRPFSSTSIIFSHARSDVKTRNSRPQQCTVKFKAGSKSCSLSKQDSYIKTRVGIIIPPSHSNAEDNRHEEFDPKNSQTPSRRSG
ncbi:hypothetical protein Tco_0375574 [Tanacetum coccineum]